MSFGVPSAQRAHSVPIGDSTPIDLPTGKKWFHRLHACSSVVLGERGTSACRTHLPTENTSTARATLTRDLVQIPCCRLLRRCSFRSKRGARHAFAFSMIAGCWARLDLTTNRDAIPSTAVRQAPRTPPQAKEALRAFDVPITCPRDATCRTSANYGPDSPHQRQESASAHPRRDAHYS